MSRTQYLWFAVDLLRSGARRLIRTAKQHRFRRFPRTVQLTQLCVTYGSTDLQTDGTSFGVVPFRPNFSRIGNWAHVTIGRLKVSCSTIACRISTILTAILRSSCISQMRFEVCKAIIRQSKFFICYFESISTASRFTAPVYPAATVMVYLGLARHLGPPHGDFHGGFLTEVHQILALRSDNAS